LQNELIIVSRNHRALLFLRFQHIVYALLFVCVCFCVCSF
jgi:hypothetical protein